ncbi:MAG: cyclic nucleotide-binding domain-containing protein [Myxococcota bacterium]
MTGEGSGAPKGGAWVVRPGVPARPAASGEDPGASQGGGPPLPPADPEVLKALQAAALFKNFTDTGLQLIASVAQEKSLPAGTPLFVEAMLGEAMYVIAAGSVRLTVRGPDGREQRLLSLGPGDSLGEASLLRVGPRLCSAFAEDAVTVIEISRRDIAQLQKTRPQACLKLLMGVVEVLGTRTKDADPDLKRFLLGSLR